MSVRFITLSLVLLAACGQDRVKVSKGDKASDYNERALETARRQGAKLWELRATVSLARLRHESGRTADARALLEQMDGWLPGGNDLADTRAARALIDRVR